ncbi:MAG: arginine--tRNA ligase, partial [Bacteroidales bacterium]|nr:arginine--tRNA ligase [Bacteroidales bacterium]
YMTQDLGTAVLRHKEYNFDKCLYVVGNEQNYHFQVLKAVLKKMGYSWADGLYHFSYGMVELPEGKMKSREGTVVDADDLIIEMKETAREVSLQLGKLSDYTDEEKEEIFRKIGLGALKYFILKVDPRKNMTFNPAESIDFNGNTGPFIQYTYARILSVFRKGEQMGVKYEPSQLSDLKGGEKEVDLVKLLRRFTDIVKESAQSYSPALVANYCYDLAKEYNQFYHDFSILSEQDAGIRNFRLALSKVTSDILHTGMWLLGIEMPERM